MIVEISQRYHILLHYSNTEVNIMGKKKLLTFNVESLRPNRSLKKIVHPQW
jgi:hypothetical protein